MHQTDGNEVEAAPPTVEPHRRCDSYQGRVGVHTHSDPKVQVTVVSGDQCFLPNSVGNVEHSWLSFRDSDQRDQKLAQSKEQTHQKRR